MSSKYADPTRPLRPPTTRSATAAAVFDVFVRALTFVAHAGFAVEVFAVGSACRALRVEEALWEPLSRVTAGRTQRTWLMAAAARGDIARVHFLAARGAHLEAHDVRGRTALLFAAEAGHTAAIAALVACGANADARDFEDVGALHVAPSAGVVRELLACGASVDARSIARQSPLQAALERGATDVAAALRAARPPPREDLDALVFADDGGVGAAALIAMFRREVVSASPLAAAVIQAVAQSLAPELRDNATIAAALAALNAHAADARVVRAVATVIGLVASKSEDVERWSENLYGAAVGALVTALHAHAASAAELADIVTSLARLLARQRPARPRWHTPTAPGRCSRLR